MQRKIREQDIFGVEVNLNLNKESQHNTFIGGCCTVILLLISALIFTQQMYYLWFTKSYS